jgi:hypothetical protein
MRRALVFGILLVTLAACTDRVRWEGHVERWLLSLNQGAAGQADRFAHEELSDRILPNAATGEPGRLDVIEVGSARRAACSFRVPFRVVRIDGVALEGFAVIQTCPTIPAHDIVDVELRSLPARTFPSEGGSAFRNTTALAWAAAIGIALGLVLLAELAMRLVHRRRVSPSEPRVGVE